MKLGRLLPLLLALALLTGCAGGPAAAQEDPLGNGWVSTGHLELKYAEQFTVDYYDGGYALLTITEGGRFLVVPEGGEVPPGLRSDIVVLKRPVDHIYLVASASMCFFDVLGALDAVTLSGTKEQDWSVEAARAAMAAGTIQYAGKYSAPDYELILSSGCRLSVQSTMIHHTPEVKDKLEALGIPVLVDRSSYEPHPLGRTEWIKLYGVLTGQEERARTLFDEQVALVEAVSGLEDTGKTVAFFYLSSSGYAVARKSGDYVSQMIGLAGGHYIFQALGGDESATSTVPLEMEAFYATARDADYIIYNSTITSAPTSLAELVGMNRLLSEFKAVREGNVWTTGKNLYQDTTQLGQMISDIHTMLTLEDNSVKALSFLTKLE